MIGDCVGFASSIFLRGVDFIQVPTTVMACVDSSVGGKTGVNHPAGKNLIGAFWQPQAVIIDLDMFDTLPPREYVSGLSEVVKYGLIRDGPFFEWLEANAQKLKARDSLIIQQAVKRSCENKAAVVEMDEREGGERAKLNLGHTYGHAIESGSGYGRWLHGEAVSIGTVMAAVHSYKEGWITFELLKRAYSILKELGLPTELPSDSVMTCEMFHEIMSVDKKVSDGVLSLILLKGELGSSVVTDTYDPSLRDETIAQFVTNRGDDFDIEFFK